MTHANRLQIEMLKMELFLYGKMKAEPQRAELDCWYSSCSEGFHEFDAVFDPSGLDSKAVFLESFSGGEAFRDSTFAALKTEFFMVQQLATWNAFKELEDFRKGLGSFFARVPVQKDENGKDWFTLSEWAPPVDIIEDEQEYLIKAELPEVGKNDVRVSVENGVLLIQGERKMEKEEKGKKYHRVERAYGSFLRSFTVPEDTDASRIAAEFRDGVLKVRIPKDESSKPKHIEVKVS